jgi:hypothetical protein
LVSRGWVRGEHNRQPAFFVGGIHDGFGGVHGLGSVGWSCVGSREVHRGGWRFIRAVDGDQAEETDHEKLGGCIRGGLGPVAGGGERNFLRRWWTLRRWSRAQTRREWLQEEGQGGVQAGGSPRSEREGVESKGGGCWRVLGISRRSANQSPREDVWDGFSPFFLREALGHRQSWPAFLGVLLVLRGVLPT